MIYRVIELENEKFQPEILYGVKWEPIGYHEIQKVLVVGGKDNPMGQYCKYEVDTVTEATSLIYRYDKTINTCSYGKINKTFTL